jgi:uncharacterized phiE125 gp8 family phage protein
MADDLYTVTVAATDDPISLEETKEFLRIDAAITVDDNFIQGLIKAAVIDGEKFTNRCFVTRTFLGELSQLDRSECEAYPYIQIRRAPLVSIASIKAVFDGTPTTVSTDDYEIKNTSAFPRVLFVETGNISVDKVAYPLQVTFNAGYGAAKDVPDDIKTALKMHILFLYENRGDVDTESKLTMPRASRALYQNYRILNTYG